MFIKTLDLTASWVKVPLMPVCSTLVVYAHKDNAEDAFLSTDSAWGTADDQVHAMEAKDSVTMYEWGWSRDWDIWVKGTVWDMITFIWS